MGAMDIAEDTIGMLELCIELLEKNTGRAQPLLRKAIKRAAELASAGEDTPNFLASSKLVKSILDLVELETAVAQERRSMS